MCIGCTEDDAVDSPPKVKQTVYCFVCHQKCITSNIYMVRDILTGLCTTCMAELDAFIL